MQIARIVSRATFSGSLTMSRQSDTENILTRNKHKQNITQRTYGHRTNRASNREHTDTEQTQTEHHTGNILTHNKHKQNITQRIAPHTPQAVLLYLFLAEVCHCG